MYVAVLIARLVGVHAAAKSQINHQALNFEAIPERIKEQAI